jgi:bacillopeptidase F
VPSNSKFGPNLQELLASQPLQPWVNVIIMLKPDPVEVLASHPDAALLDPVDRADAVARVKTAIEQFQLPVINAIKDDARDPVQSIWSSNSILATLRLNRLESLSKMNEVLLIEVNSRIPVGQVLDGRPRVGVPSKPVKPGGKPKPPKTDPLDSDEDDLSSNNGPVRQNLIDIGALSLRKETGLNGEGILVAVLDTGIKDDHPHLIDQMWDDGTPAKNHGKNMIDDSFDTMDYHGHGTACAGIVAGKHTGVAPKATLMAVTVVDVLGGDDDASSLHEGYLLKGIDFALESQCHLISMSVSIKFGTTQPNHEEWLRVTNVLKVLNVLMVCSTGNQGLYSEGCRALRYCRMTPNCTSLGNCLSPVRVASNIPAPGYCPPRWLHPSQIHIASGTTTSVIACGSCNVTAELVRSSGRGPSNWPDYVFTKGNPNSGLLKPDVLAPGVGIVTCDLADGYHPGFSGTSAAAPHVAGAVALLMEACVAAGAVTMPIARIAEALARTCQAPVGHPVPGDLVNDFGAGIINVYDAYHFGRSQSPSWW